MNNKAQKNNLVSIIIPVYNIEKYISECLKSVVKQTYHNLEIIVINDGSTDNSLKKCQDFSKEDHRINIISQKNQGLSSARNTGIEKASGDYLFFLDGDDYIDDKCIEKLLTVLNKTSSDIACCREIIINEHGEKIKDTSPDQQLSFKKEEQIACLFKKNDNIPVMAWGKLYRRHLFDHIRYPVGKYNEDSFVIHQILSLSNKTVVIPYSLYYYRKTPGSITNSKFKHNHLDGIEAALLREKFIAIKYPQFKKQASASVAYVCCTCLYLMFESNFKNKEITSDLCKKIKQRYFTFLAHSDCKISTKVFATLLTINPKAARKLIHFKRRFS